MSSMSMYSGEERQFDILQETRDIVADMTKTQRFSKARRHLIDALNFRQARNDPDTNKSLIFHIAYSIQTSSYWNYFMFALSIAYMYLIIAEPNNRLDLTVPLNPTVQILDITILSFMMLDIVLEIFHKSKWNASFSKKYPFRFWVKVVFTNLFILDSIVFYTKFTTFPLRPFRMLRAFMPYFYDYFSRKALYALYGAGKDIIVYLIFYTILIMAFSIVATQIINLPPGTVTDKFNSNYEDLGTMSFLIYVLASYDAWPDYQLAAVNTSHWYYIFFVAFIFLNCFYFVTIPTTVIFASFKSSRSKMVLIDEIKQQNSLLLCFVTLGEKNLTIKSETFHQFMMYVYKNKLRLVDHIKQLSYKLDPNNNSIIFVSDFMKLCKLMQDDEHMMPPRFQDWQLFMRLRRWMRKNWYLKKIVKSDIFDIVVILVIIINFIIIMISFFQPVYGYETLEIFLMAFYTMELLIRLLGQGPEKFSNDGRNWLDVALLLVSFVLLSDNQDISVTVRKMSRLIRLFRINRIVRIFWRNEFFRKKIYLSPLYQRLRLLFNQLYICTMVGLRLFPLFMTCFYVLSVIGMQRFDNRFGVAQQSSYSVYDKVSSFRNLIEAHLVIVQVMIEAGWSPIVFDYAERYDSFGEVVIFFVSIHICIVIILVSLMKGMVADFFETIYNKYEELLKHQLGILEKERQEKERRLEFEDIRSCYLAGKQLTQDTIKKKQIKQAKKNRQLIQAFKNMLREQQNQDPLKPRNNIRTLAIKQNNSAKDIFMMKKIQVMANHSLSPECFAGIGADSQVQLIHLEVGAQSDDQIRNLISDQKVIEARSLCDEDIEGLDDDFVHRVALKEEDIPYSTTPFYPTFLKEFLKKRMIMVGRRRKSMSQAREEFNLNKERVGDNTAITSFYTTTLENLLHMEKPEEERKKQILQDILKLKLDSDSEIEKRVKKKYDSEKKVSIDVITRKVFLSNTNEELIQKFQIEYFSNIYGNSFKEMSRVTIEPILRHQALLLDILTKVMRYPQIETADFFHIIATIEYKISNFLSKKGSIFKFVFQVEELAGNWFAIQVKENKQLRLHFLKTSIWIYDQHMVNDQIYYGHDIFWYNKSDYAKYEVETCQKIIRLLYNAFQSLAFSMLNQNNFFTSDPADNIYDVYSVVIPCNSPQRLNPPSKKQFNLKISKIMLVILSKQNERPKNKKLDYKLTNLKTILQEKLKNKPKDQFKFDDDQNQTFEKLKNLAAQDEEKIAESEGLPYCFLIDMIVSVQNILKLHKQNLIEKAEKVLNQQFNKDVFSENATHQSIMGSRLQI